MMNMSPAPVVQEMDWPTAQKAILAGQKITRVAWNNPVLCVFIAQFDVEWLVHRTAEGRLDKLVLCGADLRATDWIVVREH